VTLLHARTHARTPVVTEIATTTTINNNRASTTTTIIIIIIVTALTDRQHALRQLDVGVRDPHQRARHPCTPARPPARHAHPAPSQCAHTRGQTGSSAARATRCIMIRAKDEKSGWKRGGVPVTAAVLITIPAALRLGAWCRAVSGAGE
jgi:hypothetical protein